MPYIFHIYLLDMFHCHPCIFPCEFLNLWSQEKTSPYRKTMFISFINFVKIPFLDLKGAKLDRNSDFGHVRTYSSLHKLRNTQGKIHGTYLGNIYGIYKECIRNIHRYLWYKVIRNTDSMGRPPKVAAPLGRRWRRRLCFWLSYIINISGYSLYIPYILLKYVAYVFLCVFLNLFSLS